MADKTKIIVRRAERFDLIALELLLSKGIEESKGLLPPYDWGHVYHAAVNQLQAGLIFVASEAEKIIGCLSLDAQKWTWNPAFTVLRSVHFYVLPEERAKTLPDGKTLVFQGLLQAGQWLADQASSEEYACPLIVEQLHSLGPDNRAAAKDELMTRAGFAYAGGNFVYLGQPPKAEAAE